MIDRAEATARARQYVAALEWPGIEEMVLHERGVLERPFGWVFFYDSRKFIETRDPGDAAIGNSPIIVDRRDGSIHVTGTARPLEYYLEQYARSRAPDAPDEPPA